MTSVDNAWMKKVAFLFQVERQKGGEVKIKFSRPRGKFNILLQSPDLLGILGVHVAVEGVDKVLAVQVHGEPAKKE